MINCSKIRLLRHIGITVFHLLQWYNAKLIGSRLIKILRCTAGTVRSQHDTVHGPKLIWAAVDLQNISWLIRNRKAPFVGSAAKSRFWLLICRSNVVMPMDKILNFSVNICKEGIIFPVISLKAIRSFQIILFDSPILNIPVILIFGFGSDCSQYLRKDIPGMRIVRDVCVFSDSVSAKKPNINQRLSGWVGH